jgi:hypothetical protein
MRKWLVMLGKGGLVAANVIAGVLLLGLVIGAVRGGAFKFPFFWLLAHWLVYGILPGGVREAVLGLWGAQKTDPLEGVRIWSK